MLKIIRHINLNKVQKPAAYIIQSANYNEVTTNELKQYANDENVEVILDADMQEAHVIKKQY